MAHGLAFSIFHFKVNSCDSQTIITNMLVLPTSQHKQIYYCTLVTEICKLSAATCGPAVGKSIRKLYGLLSDGLDVEVARKFSEWFSIHMSYFAYQWVWKEWCAAEVSILDLAICDSRSHICASSQGAGSRARPVPPEADVHPESSRTGGPARIL